MENIANLLFEARILKKIPRAGYAFLGCGKESVAEHSFSATFIAYVLSRLEPKADALKLITMCLVHDLPEARIGDLNYVQKKYVVPREDKAVMMATQNLPFGNDLADLIQEFNEGETIEARLAHDADQLSLILDLKALSDVGYASPQKWLPHVMDRLQTETGKSIAASILKTDWDHWWLNNYVDR
jgi:putative hydrolase of HD superfamily